jgi:heme exporter protein D
VGIRQYLGLAGILLALAGMALENRYLIWAAMAVLALSILLRVLRSIHQRRTGIGAEPDQNHQDG